MESAQADVVYELVTIGFTNLGVSAPQCISRAFLLKEGFYAGQVYRCQAWHAIWLLDGSSLEFYDTAGNQVKTLPLAPEVTRKAA